MPEKRDEGDLTNTVRKHRRRHIQGLKFAEGSIFHDLAWMGGIAWLIVIPLLMGAFIGRMLDRLFGSGITMSAAFIVIGACVGGYLAWRRVIEP